MIGGGGIRGLGVFLEGVLVVILKNFCCLKLFYKIVNLIKSNAC